MVSGRFHFWMAMSFPGLGWRVLFRSKLPQNLTLSKNNLPFLGPQMS